MSPPRASGTPSQLRRLRSRRRHRRPFASRRGVTDVPLELLIIVIILAIVVPIIVAALLAYTTEQQNLSAQEAADAVRDVAVQAYDDGINTTLLVTVTMPSNAQLTLGASLFVTGGHLNPQAGIITYGPGSPPQTCWDASVPVNCVYVVNGAGNIALTNVTCTGVWPAITYTYHPFPVFAGTTTLALTKIAPGAFLCGVPPPTNATAGFVEVQPTT